MKKSRAQLIREYLEAHPDAKASMIAKKFKVSNDYIYQIKSKMKMASSEIVTKIEVDDPRMPKFVDNVNHPPHYKIGGMETIDFIEAKELDYHIGNVVKYLTRAKHKRNELEDLKKAQWYLDRAINKLAGK